MCKIYDIIFFGLAIRSFMIVHNALTHKTIDPLVLSLFNSNTCPAGIGFETLKDMYSTDRDEKFCE